MFGLFCPPSSVAWEHTMAILSSFPSPSCGTLYLIYSYLFSSLESGFWRREPQTLARIKCYLFQAEVKTHIFCTCLIGSPQMPSCGFHNSPRANVAQLGHWSSEKLTGLRIMICSVQSSGVVLIDPLPLRHIGHETVQSRWEGRQMSLKAILFQI